MTTLQAVELGVLGPLQVRQDGALVAIPGAKPRALLTMLGLHAGSVVPADALVELLWSEDPPRTAAKALQTHISALRRALGDGFVVTLGTGWTVAGATSDAQRYKSAAQRGRAAAAAGDTSQAVACFEEALSLWRGVPELPDTHRGSAEKTRWIEGHSALVEDRADALLATGRAAEIVGELESAVAEAPLRERRWGQLMLALYRAGRQGEALGAYQRARTLLAEELGVDPGPELRRLEAAVVAQDSALEVPAVQNVSSIMRAVTFLLTDIEGSTAAWEADAAAMALALARHDEIVEQVVTSRGGRLIKTRGEGDATFSVFDRPSAAAAAAVELQEAIGYEPWALDTPMRIRAALHTGEAEFRDGDYFGRAVNRAARLRSLAAGGQIVCSGATAELVIDSLADDVVLVDLGTRQLRNLARPEHVFELRLVTAGDRPDTVSTDVPLDRPPLPAVLAGPGPFVGRGSELEQLHAAWQNTLGGATSAVLVAGEPGVGKTRLAGEWSHQAYEQGAVILYGRCDEDLGAPYQPFAEALRALAPCLGASRLRGLRGVEALLPMVPALKDSLPDLATPTRADPDTERYALFDAVVALLGLASASAPVVLVLDDLHWAAKPTLLLLRHLLRFGDQAPVQIVGTYRSTDLDRSHPLAAMLADLHRDGTAHRLSLGGLDEDAVSAYVAEAGYDDEELGRALASVTGGNPFFLIEALRHVDESGGQWDQSSLPQGVREAVSRRLSRMSPGTNKALGAAAVVGSRFALELVEQVVGDDLVDAFDEACKAGIVIEEPGGRYRFNHALVRQSLLAELPSVRRMRLHQRIATTLENQPGADDELLADLAHHYFECAWAGNAGKAVEYCRRAADQAMARLAYEGAADLYDRAVHALEELDDEVPDRADQAAELLIARCEALLAAGDATTAVGAVAHLQSVTVDSERLAAWATCFDGQLSMLTHPERLDEVEAGVAAAAARLAELDDAAGEAKAHTVRAGCLARLGRVGDCEIALDDALSAARRAHEHRRVNAVLAGAPLAALWGPNPVPRAGGRCLDVIRLLRITTDSPAVEVTSTRCQAVLEAFRGRDAAARRMIDSARRMITESGLRHTLLEVEQFAGIVELVADDPAAAEACLRKAYSGFRRMGLEADVAETAALLGRTCLALDRHDEADELCSESERLAGDALKASIAWRTLRAQLLSRTGDHAGARRLAESAVALAERTDGLVDHGDACLALAAVLGAAGDSAGQRAAAERAAELYGRKGAVALVEKAHRVIGADTSPRPQESEAARTEPTNTPVQVGDRLIDAVNRAAWDEVALFLAPRISMESRRKIVGFPRGDIAASQWIERMKNYLATGMMRYRHTVLAVRGERFALTRLEIGTEDHSPGSPRDEMLHLIGLDREGRVASQVRFDVEDVDAAMAELDALYAQSDEPHSKALMENTASRLYDRVQALFAARDIDSLRELCDDDFINIDRRRTVNAGTRRGLAAMVEDARASSGLGVSEVTSDVVATRGEHLVLRRARYSGNADRPDAFHVDLLNVIEVNSAEKVTALIGFEPADLDAAYGELEARFLAGEGAPHANTWSVVTQAFVALNRCELPATTPDWVNVDHRRGPSIPPGEVHALIGAAWHSATDLKHFIVSVHRLDELGAVVTHVAQETSREGFRAEWRVVSMMTVQDNLLHRLEVFDEADLETAIERFDAFETRLKKQDTRPLQNAATRAEDRVFALFSESRWEELSELHAEDIRDEDRRRGLRRSSTGRAAHMGNVRAIAAMGVDIITTPVAVRGRFLSLSFTRFELRDAQPSAFNVETLQITRVDSAGIICAQTIFDVDDFGAAIAELDERYLAGEAAVHAGVWRAIVQVYGTMNRREVPKTTTGFVDVDHRRLAAIGAGDLKAYVAASFDDTGRGLFYIETVHRLTDLGGVITHVASGTSRSGVDADWRITGIYMVEEDLISRYEIFDDTDVDIALARFEELNQAIPRLENAAARVYARNLSGFEAGDWDALAASVAEDYVGIDRRRIVKGEAQHGRDAVMAELKAAAEVGFRLSVVSVIAVRGARLVLARARGTGLDAETVQSDVLDIVEVDGDGLVKTSVMYDLEDFDAALAELDARYMAGEAAPHSAVWQAVAGVYTAVNNREMPTTTADFVDIDHRRLTSTGSGDLRAYVAAAFDDLAEFSLYVESVHKLTRFGAVVTHVAVGTPRSGAEFDWRVIGVYTVEGELISRYEMFDEADLDAALARLEELSCSTTRLENTASRVVAQGIACFVADDWVSGRTLAAEDFVSYDRRRVINTGTLVGFDAVQATLKAASDVGYENMTSTVIATRGERLVIDRLRFSGRDSAPEPFVSEMLRVIEIDERARMSATVFFDPDDIDAAFEELDTRYLAGEAAPYAQVWSVIAGAYAAFDRGLLPPTDWVIVDHRRVTPFTTRSLNAALGNMWDLTPDLSNYIKAVHRLTRTGAVITRSAYGTSKEGFSAEWRAIDVLTVEGGRINRCEVFDETDLGSAVERLDELGPASP